MVADDVYKIYLREKDKLKDALKGQRICLIKIREHPCRILITCLTINFIDEDWKMKKM